MIVRPTVKLGEKIKVPPKEWLPADPNPLADWSAHVFTANRIQYIILTNTTSLYSRVIFGRGITNADQFLRSFSLALAEFMHNDGFDDVYERQIAPTMAQVSFAKALNRRITASVNNLVYMAGAYLEIEEQSLDDLSFWLNETPMKRLAYESPRAAMEQLVKQV